ncbi:hypothetical protein CSAL01_07589 [Colletotrichum salicis]|uniref:Xylanolytic transcriptional activator regulatory domain-containing protein n=1 Tax=Colletotrichum salicis TaxID=1209931 RepID=A0A135S4V6_9PEZI|nr:hypothetical protein CSAL01_07589 [Colletotrichum salicis]
MRQDSMYLPEQQATSLLEGEPFFITPSEELLKQIVFSPEKVSHNAWPVYFNYIMLIQVSTEQQDDGKLEAARFRQNMRIASNDSRIFLEPRQVNVQALALLAVHGEDYASPNLSDVESYQRSLSMFWLLFVLDKSCALAFGRSRFLPMNVYRDAPLPDFSHLLKFQPHLDSEFSSAPSSARPSKFGAHFFIKGIELAKIMGLVVDMLAPGSSTTSRDTIRLQLEEWSHQTKEILDETIEAERRLLEPTQLKEMSLSLNSLRFQYLHIMIILLKGDKSSNNHRLECAREALFILPSIVSNWSSVYNGVVWNLEAVESAEGNFFELSQGTLDEFTLDDGLDIENVLNWLPADVFASGPSLGPGAQRDPESAGENPETSFTAEL